MKILKWGQQLNISNGTPKFFRRLSDIFEKHTKLMVFIIIFVSVSILGALLQNNGTKAVLGNSNKAATSYINTSENTSNTKSHTDYPVHQDSLGTSVNNNDSTDNAENKISGSITVNGHTTPITEGTTIVNNHSNTGNSHIEVNINSNNGSSSYISNYSQSVTNSSSNSNSYSSSSFSSNNSNISN